MKDQPQTVQISCNICAFIKHTHYPQCLFRYLYVIMLSLSYRYQVNVDCINFTLCVILLKISTDKVTTLKYIFTCI